jgi:ABC-2 type transport system ATP-binding protein
VAEKLRDAPGVEAVAVFGAALHASGADEAALARAIDAVRGAAGLRWESAEPTLEDVFIHLLASPAADERRAA